MFIQQVFKPLSLRDVALAVINEVVAAIAPDNIFPNSGQHIFIDHEQVRHEGFSIVAAIEEPQFGVHHKQRHWLIYNGTYLLYAERKNNGIFILDKEPDLHIRMVNNNGIFEVEHG